MKRFIPPFVRRRSRDVRYGLKVNLVHEGKHIGTIEVHASEWEAFLSELKNEKEPTCDSTSAMATSPLSA